MKRIDWRTERRACDTHAVEMNGVAYFAKLKPVKLGVLAQWFVREMEGVYPASDSTLNWGAAFNLRRGNSLQIIGTLDNKCVSLYR